MSKPWIRPGDMLSYHDGRGLAVCVDHNDSFIDSASNGPRSDMTMVVIVNDATENPLTVGALYWLPDNLVDAPDGNYLTPKPLRLNESDDSLSDDAFSLLVRLKTGAETLSGLGGRLLPSEMWDKAWTRVRTAVRELEERDLALHRDSVISISDKGRALLSRDEARGDAPGDNQ